MSSEALQALERIVEEGGDADDVLRAAVEVLLGEPAVAWAGIRFLEAGELVLGPSSGSPDEARRLTTPIAYRGEPVGELVVDGEADSALLDRFARARLAVRAARLGHGRRGLGALTRADARDADGPALPRGLRAWDWTA